MKKLQVVKKCVLIAREQGCKKTRPRTKKKPGYNQKTTFNKKNPFFSVGKKPTFPVFAGRLRTVGYTAQVFEPLEPGL